ncbi:hypothetical protein LNQ82_00720 [Conchiformibius steedae DSM 2580]|uniref:Uncharacterized protein n=1 Tax=Conchiformibius steedae DSM 2580 TaxID=1121352 RepID=A0AAE9L046_9NEIS|nr:hypothetical protein [Conchiformibius steedae]QMT33090.1 hypothetical protein H3L98_08270 [Conchiformibius steedae]URD67719.1 hypothetical protein LNQ82_00720 [Conchiformibius steedae DSM 2580]
MFKYKAKLVKLDEEIEELGFFIINGIELLCFISSVTFQLELNKEYLVELTYQILDEYHINNTPEQYTIGFKNINNNFNYHLYGSFKENILSVNSIKFTDEFLVNHFPYLENKNIVLFIDRLEISIEQVLNEQE